MRYLRLFVLLLIVLTGCGDRQGETGAVDRAVADSVAVASAATSARITLSAAEAASMSLQLADVSFDETQKTISVPARVITDPDQQAAVSAPVEGRIGRVLVRQGQSVAAGQVLATVVSMHIGDLIADLLRSESDLRTSDAAVQRLRELAAGDAASRKQLLDAENAHTGARAAAAAALQRCKAAGMTSDDLAALRKSPSDFEPELRLRAPIGGVISMRNASTGMPVSPGIVLFAILGTQYATVEGSVFEDDFSGIETGQPATFVSTAYPGQKFPGVIAYVAPTIDEASHALPVRVRLKNSGGLLRPNLFGRLDIRTAARDTVRSVPSDALVYDGNDRFLFVSDGGNRYVYRRVETGREFDGAIEITRGVSVGERVVSSGVFHLKSRFKLAQSAEEE